ncbi:asparaginase [Pseudomonas sp. SORT22]|uniref:asparaginase n=1 Tax=Pseudomonas sp. SORT22 TaxID=2813842 RepID=UPI001BCC44A2|nr:asparaginase [Pseudomonas sp. SORT22]QVM97941.1 asparaginase [Pseudomonas sp. SORT22]
MTLPKLAIGTLGGTLSMLQSAAGEGVTPGLDSLQMLADAPGLADLAHISAKTLQLLPSASLSFIQLIDVLYWAKSQVEEGAHAVVLSQGTDTLEEVAYFLELLWPFDAPLILTGAMRAASEPGADGPANLLAAVRVALDAQSRGRGALVVVNDQIHAAAHVRKTESLAMAAFSSPHFGCEGLLIEGRVCYLKPTRPRQPLPEPWRLDQRVVLLEAYFAADTLLLEQVAGLGYEGLVIAGFGAGHVSAAWAKCLGYITTRMPVIIASRTGSGPTANHTYGFDGGEMDLQRKGALMAGFLCPRKCRVLLWVLIGCGMDDELEHWLAGYRQPR